MYNFSGNKGKAAKIIIAVVVIVIILAMVAIPILSHLQ